MKMYKTAGKDTRILELETSGERLGQAGGRDNSDKETLLKACESDKVAASNAMRQNMQLTQRTCRCVGCTVKLL